MKEIQLSKGKVALVDDADYEELSGYKWYYGCGGYAARNVRRENGSWSTELMHRSILTAHKGQLIDHINHDKLDNQRSNLRLATGSQNQQNRRSTMRSSTSRYKGVSWDKRCNKWMVKIKINNIQTFLGYFADEIKAAIAYNDKAAEFYGEFACLNTFD